MYRLLALGLAAVSCGLLLASSSAAQPVYSADDFRDVEARVHTRTSYGIGAPEALGALTRLTGGPHVFDLRGVALVSGAAQHLTPVVCEAQVPGCDLPDLLGASTVLRTREHGDVYQFYDFQEDGIYHRGLAGEVIGEASGAALAGALTLPIPDRTLALPLKHPLQWTSHFSQQVVADGGIVPLGVIEAERKVVAWGTLETEHGAAEVLLVHEQRVTSSPVGGVALRDTAHTYRLVAPHLRATLDVGAGGNVVSASLDVYTRVATSAEAPVAPPQRVHFHAPQPNPAQYGTDLSFTLEQSAAVTLDVYDALGRRVARLVEGPLAAGTHTARWAAEVPAGTYYVRLVAGPVALTRTVVRVD